MLLRWLYTLFFYLALPFIFLRLLWRSRLIPDYRERWSERLGFFKCPKAWQGGIWIHTVSVGEFIAAIPLIKALQKQNPSMPIIVTTMTITGSKQVKASLGDRVFHVYVPYDIPDAIHRFLHRTKARVLIILETELWPNLFHMAHQRGIPIMLANARLSERSARGYRYISAATKSMLRKLDVIAAHAQDDAERFIQLGADPASVHVTGNIKFAVDVPASVLEQSDLIHSLWGKTRPIWVAASTHEGEEEMILDVFGKILRHEPNTLLVLVPRHPERFASVIHLCEKRGYPLVTRSSGEACSRMTQVFIGDTMGELKLFYAPADIAFIGGSLVPIGGHNVLESISANTATVIGPHTHNFADITQQLLSNEGLIQVQNKTELMDTILRLLQSSHLRAQLCHQGQLVIEQNRSALTKQVALAESLLSSTLRNINR